MDKLGQRKKILKLSDSDRKTLLVYSNVIAELEAKFTSEAAVNKNIIKLY